MGPIALPCTFSLDNNAFALNFKTMRICKEKVVTGRNGADLKATETGEKEKKHAQKNKSHCAGKHKENKNHMSSMLQCLHQLLNEVRLLVDS